jgi:hypothetical protein
MDRSPAPRVSWHVLAPSARAQMPLLATALVIPQVAEWLKESNFEPMVAHYRSNVAWRTVECEKVVFEDLNPIKICRRDGRELLTKITVKRTVTIEVFINRPKLWLDRAQSVGQPVPKSFRMAQRWPECSTTRSGNAGECDYGWKHHPAWVFRARTSILQGELR